MLLAGSVGLKKRGWTRIGCRSALVGMLVILAPGRVAAAEKAGDLLYGFNLSAALGYAVPTTDEFSNSFTYRLGVGYSLNSLFALDFSLGRFMTDVEHGRDFPPDGTIADGEMDITSAVLALQLRYPIPQLFSTFYAVAGGGYYFIDYSWSDGSRDYFQKVEELYSPPLQDVSDSFGFNFGAGLEYPLSAHFSMNLEGQYVYLKPDSEGDWRNLLTGDRHQFSEDLDLNTWTFTVGIRYFF